MTPAPATATPATATPAAAALASAGYRSGNDRPHDVAVVGAGLAGLQCALGLGRAGLRVLLLDARARLDRGVHTTGIFVRRTLADFAFPSGSLGPAVRHVTLYSPAGRPLELESPHAEFRVGRMGPLYLALLEECLETGCEWRPETQVLGCEPSGGEVLLHLRGSAPVRASFVVGADGARSRVAAGLGLDRNHEWIVGVEEVLRGVPLDGPPRFHCFLDPRLAPGYLAWVVHDGEEVHLGVGGYAHRFEPARALVAFRRRAADVVDLSGASLVERRGGSIPVGGVLRRIAEPHGLLVGDAAGAPSPLTAGGLDPCMRLSRLAVEVIPEYLRRGDPAALAPYDGARFRGRFASRLAMRRLLAGLGSPALLEAACAFLRLPPGRSLAWHVFFGRGSFPDPVAPGSAVLSAATSST